MAIRWAFARRHCTVSHLAHKAEHAVDMERGAVIAVTVQAANAGDTQTVEEASHFFRLIHLNKVSCSR